MDITLIMANCCYRSTIGTVKEIFPCGHAGTHRLRDGAGLCGSQQTHAGYKAAKDLSLFPLFVMITGLFGFDGQPIPVP